MSRFVAAHRHPRNFWNVIKISEDKTNEQKTYTGSKIQNHFTAYLIQFVRGKRHDYLEKKIQMADAEELLEDIGQMEARIVIEELLENQTREQLLLQEAQGKYQNGIRCQMKD